MNTNCIYENDNIFQPKKLYLKNCNEFKRFLSKYNKNIKIIDQKINIILNLSNRYFIEESSCKKEKFNIKFLENSLELIYIFYDIINNIKKFIDSSEYKGVIRKTIVNENYKVYIAINDFEDHLDYLNDILSMFYRGIDEIIEKGFKKNKNDYFFYKKTEENIKLQNISIALKFIDDIKILLNKLNNMIDLLSYNCKSKFQFFPF